MCGDGWGAKGPPTHPSFNKTFMNKEENKVGPFNIVGVGNSIIKNAAWGCPCNNRQEHVGGRSENKDRTSRRDQKGAPDGNRAPNFSAFAPPGEASASNEI